MAGSFRIITDLSGRDLRALPGLMEALEAEYSEDGYSGYPEPDSLPAVRAALESENESDRVGNLVVVLEGRDSEEMYDVIHLAVTKGVFVSRWAWSNSGEPGTLVRVEILRD